MNNYRELYEKYYSNLKKGRSKTSSNANKGYLSNNYNFKKKCSLVNKFIIQLSISICMIVFFLGCKAVNNEQCNKVLAYANTVITKSYDYKSIINKLENMTLDDVENMSVHLIDKIKAGFIGGKTIIEELKTEYSIPVMAGKVYEENDKNNKMTFKIDKTTKITSCNLGKVKKISVDEDLGNYIVIDHGKGIESKYYNLSKIFVKVGDEIEKGKVIGEVYGDVKNSKEFYFEILYMGKPQDVYESIAI